MTESIRLSRHADLKVRGGQSILVMPERAVRLGGSGAEILGLCREPIGEDEVVSAMRARYPDFAAIESEVRGFLAEMVRIGALVACRECAEAKN